MCQRVVGSALVLSAALVGTSYTRRKIIISINCAAVVRVYGDTSEMTAGAEMDHNNSLIGASQGVQNEAIKDGARYESCSLKSPTPSPIPLSDTEMEFFEDLQIANQFEREAPSNTLGNSPVLDAIIAYLRVTPDSYLEQELHSKEFTPHFLMDPNHTIRDALSKDLFTQTPIDQTLVIALATGFEGTPSHGHVTLLDLEDQFDFCIRQVHCLDYLDYIRRVLYVITQKAIEFEMDMWAEYEAATILGTDDEVAQWYHHTPLPVEDYEGASVDEILDATAELVRRTGRMMEVLGEHYSCEMIAVIKQRPQHTVGSYFVTNHNVAVGRH